MMLSLFGKEVPTGKLPIDLGYLMFNVATAKAIYEAVVEDQPLLNRIVTVTGKGIKLPQNVEAMLGTPVSELIEYCGGYTKVEISNKPYAPTPKPVHQLIMGGPLMGISLPTKCIGIANRRTTQKLNALMYLTVLNVALVIMYAQAIFL